MQRKLRCIRTNVSGLYHESCRPVLAWTRILEDRIVEKTREYIHVYWLGYSTKSKRISTSAADRAVALETNSITDSGKEYLCGKLFLQRGIEKITHVFSVAWCGVWRPSRFKYFSVALTRSVRLAPSLAQCYKVLYLGIIIYLWCQLSHRKKRKLFDLWRRVSERRILNRCIQQTVTESVMYIRSFEWQDPHTTQDSFRFTKIYNRSIQLRDGKRNYSDILNFNMMCKFF